MPSYGYGDSLQRTVDVLIRNGGTGDVDQIKDAVTQLQAVLDTTARVMRDNGSAAEEMAAAMRPIANDIRSLNGLLAEYERATEEAAKATQEWADLQAALGAMEARTAEQTQEATRAIQEGTAAVAENMAAIKKEEADEGNAKRARIDALVRAELAEEQWAKTARQAAETVRQVEGDAIRERAEGHARAERAAEADAAKTEQMAAAIREADEGIARAEHMAMMASDEAIKKRDAEAGRAQWLANQINDLSQALQGLAAGEMSAAAASTTMAGKMQESGVKAAGATGAFGMNLRTIAYTLDDLQYVGEMGLRPIVNNLMMINPVLGMAVMGVETLRRNWGGLMELAGVGIKVPKLDGIEGIKDQIKETEKVIDDLRKHSRLDLGESMKFEQATAKAKELNAELERQKAILDLMGSTSKEQKARASGFEEAIGESGGGHAVLDLIREAFSRKADDKGRVMDDTTGKFTDAKTAAENLLLEAKKGLPGAANQVSALARSVPGGEGFAETITATSPEQKALEAATKDAQTLLDQINKANAKTPGYDPDDPFDKAQMENEIWLGSGKPKREAAEKNAKAKARAEKASQRAGADDIRDALRDVAVGGGDAAARQEAINKVADRIKAQSATLGAELTGDLMRQAHAAYNAAAKQGESAEAKAQRQGRPGAMVNEAAKPIVDRLVAGGVPQGKAHSAVTQEIEAMLRQGLDLAQAQAVAMDQVPAFLESYGLQIAQLQRKAAHTRGKMAHLHGQMRVSQPQVTGSQYPFPLAPFN